eukprot:jgi/Botrbrau1/22417/Bobra.0091s0022.1
MEPREKGPSSDFLSHLAEVYDAVASNNPRLDVVPLHPFAGWTTDKVANLTDLYTVFGTHSAHGSDFLETLRASRDPSLPGIADQLVQLQPKRELHDQTDQGKASVTSTGASESMEFERTAVGGTFDRLHAGHRILLAATALVTTAYVYVGVTGDKLLHKKAHRHLLGTYEEREAAAVAFLKSVRPALSIVSGALLDPQEPTAAATQREMQALVVSEETVPGATSINEWRSAHGFPQLTIIIVKLVGRQSSGDKLSSTKLREEEAAQQGDSQLHA